MKTVSLRTQIKHQKAALVVIYNRYAHGFATKAEIDAAQKKLFELQFQKWETK